MKSDKRPPWSVNDLWDRYEAERAAHIRQLEIIAKLNKALPRMGEAVVLKDHDDDRGWYVWDIYGPEGPFGDSPLAAVLAWYDNLPEEAP